MDRCTDPGIVLLHVNIAASPAHPMALGLQDSTNATATDLYDMNLADEVYRNQFLFVYAVCC
jgi:hypothetical protein